MVVNIQQEQERASRAAFQSFSRNVVGTRGYRPTLSRPTLPHVEKKCPDSPHVLTSTATETAPPKLLQPPQEVTAEQHKDAQKPKVISGAFAEYLELMETAQERRKDTSSSHEQQDALLSIGFQHLYSMYGRSWDI